MMTYVTQNPIHPPIPPPLSAIQGASPMWTVCASGYGQWVQSMPSGPYRLKRDDQNGTHQDICFWRRSQEFLATPAVAFRLIRGSSSHIYGLAFQIVALALNSGVNLCA